MEFAHSDFSAAFIEGSQLWSDNNRRRYVVGPVIAAGVFRTPYGRVVICDPFDVQYFEFGMLKRSLVPGSYPVFVATLYSEREDTDERIHWTTTCAKLVASNLPVKTWELAMRDEGSPELSQLAIEPGFQLASGVSCFAEPQLVKNGNRQLFSLQFARWAQSMQRSDGWQFGEFEDPKYPSANVVAIQSGDHDGTAVGWWGLDQNDEIAQLVIDFRVLVETVYDERVILLQQVRDAGILDVHIGGNLVGVSVQSAKEPESDILVEIRGDFENYPTPAVHPFGEGCLGRVVSGSITPVCTSTLISFAPNVWQNAQIKIATPVGESPMTTLFQPSTRQSDG
ncbi:hypothetical protein ETAA8_37080 [Anatilimnocola aggregata]|uniref:Uncharacterized protein n=1 Tax=Anatilimnocola aggregata TaxID=2528021 RepID=A0A517YEE5_9BACT|nr:DUF4241 domain-containing protein [Anatilimnocola aggregata]QDU28605.1 hypothetical protein ETAA8_37080 [Anatilimnocola aggregata]